MCVGGLAEEIGTWGRQSRRSNGNQNEHSPTYGARAGFGREKNPAGVISESEPTHD